MLKILLKTIIFLVVVFIVGEVVLRYQFGFCQAPLYIADPDYEYIYAPNQEVVRFGNTIRTNELSMRSEPVLPTDTTVILLTGDSVVLGGSLTDQDSLASTMLEKRLTRTLRRRVRVLNIAAGSWGPDNVAAYLKKHGLFNADLICLVASSHDAHDNMTHENMVGVDTNLPDKQYTLAWEELWKRYLFPRYVQEHVVGTNYFAPRVDTTLLSGIRKEGDGFNPGFAQLAAMARQQGIPFFIYLHPEISEIEFGNYNGQGREIIRYAEQDSVRLIKELDLGITVNYFRKNDVVHYNSGGQIFMANKLYPLFLEYLQPAN
ncbi:hypothetical protein GCM10027275_15670 [Rhabdobacter roseus]|uniref:SGNH hydrolase-type esterase domain-containing protein n=1 Tax=Rhabdobacter roseus TaxID=1655419 RepID=A0A840TP16_9BACT|nr:hypothetical protein [Rhabdobacter roseus]MBB5283487.1 hypothetical protein [Rhabdobacter roseus]